MKFILFIFLIITLDLDSCLGQEFPYQKLGTLDFSLIECNVSENEKLNLLQRLVFKKDLFPVNFENSNSYDYDNYHLLDLDLDGDLDIIYSGKNPRGMESNKTVFFLNKNDSLKPILNLKGDIAKFERIDSHLIRFQIIKSPCCANYIFTHIDYVLKYSEDNVLTEKNTYIESDGLIRYSSYIVNLYAYVLKTEFPISVNNKRQFISINKTFLTPKPNEPSSINFNEKGFVFRFSENKAISQLPIGTNCNVLSEKQNANGDVFCFIVLRTNQKKLNYMSQIKFDQFGWVRKNDIIEL